MHVRIDLLNFVLLDLLMDKPKLSVVCKLQTSKLPKNTFLPLSDLIRIISPIKTQLSIDIALYEAAGYVDGLLRVLLILAVRVAHKITGLRGSFT